MVRHAYIVVDCKTQDCRTFHVLMHLGEKGKTPEKVEYWMSYPLILDCPSCGKAYDYSDIEEKFWQKELPPPPVGYSNRLVLPTVQGAFVSEEKLMRSQILPRAQRVRRAGSRDGSIVGTKHLSESSGRASISQFSVPSAAADVPSDRWSTSCS